jgi:hypothetical protein
MKDESRVLLFHPSSFILFFAGAVMSRFLFVPRSPLVLLLGAALAAGCGGSSVKLVPVSGKVTVGGQPVTSGQVSFLPVTEGEGVNAKASAGSAPALGQIEPSGEYKLFTNGKEGAPPGKYKVTVTPSMVPSGGTKAPTTPYNAKFSDVKQTPLNKEVVSGAAAGAYDLALTK